MYIHVYTYVHTYDYGGRAAFFFSPFEGRAAEGTGSPRSFYTITITITITTTTTTTTITTTTTTTTTTITITITTLFRRSVCCLLLLLY